MSLWSDVYKQALNVEEAALLPARSGSMAGKSALQDALRKAEHMERLQLSNVVEGDMNSGMEGIGNASTIAYSFPGSRAALHHVRPKW